MTNTILLYKKSTYNHTSLYVRWHYIPSVIRYTLSATYVQSDIRNEKQPDPTNLTPLKMISLRGVEIECMLSTNSYGYKFSSCS